MCTIFLQPFFSNVYRFIFTKKIVVFYKKKKKQSMNDCEKKNTEGVERKQKDSSGEAKLLGDITL